MHKKRIVILIGLVLLLWGGIAGAGETLTKNTAVKRNVSPLSNIGFMKNPSKQLKEKFPMCDAFLKVEWIDRGKRIGYSRYDVYQDGNKKGQMTALIYLNQYFPHFDYDLNEYRRRGQLDDIFSFIREGKIVGNEAILTIRQKNQERTFFPHTPNGTTFSDNRQNVCVPYPNGHLAWMVEVRQVGKTFTDQQIKDRYEKLQKSLTDIQFSSFKDMNVIDLNHDGEDDYYRYLPWIIYSHKDQYFEIEKSGAGYNYIELYFPHSKNKFTLQPHRLDYLTTDGENYFSSNQCNLTESTKGGEHHE